MARAPVLALVVLVSSAHAQEQRSSPSGDVYIKARETLHTRAEWVACVDDQLREHKLNEYGDPQASTYSPDLSRLNAAYRAVEKYSDLGPLDDDMRLALTRYGCVLHRRPDIAEACTSASTQDMAAQDVAEPSVDETNEILHALRDEDEKHALAVLRVRLVAPSTVKRGQPVKFAYEIVNTSVAHATTKIGNLPKLIIERRGAAGGWTEVWSSWGDGLLRTGPLITYAVAASTPYHYETTWNQTDSNGVTVASGEYRVSAPSSTPAPAAVTFRLVD